MIRPPDEANEPAEGAAAETALTAAGDPGAIEDDASKYTIHLDSFEGPLDLLLYLIQRDEIDVYDIPIAHITKQYLASLDALDIFGLDNAGEFLVMAATLMRIKARMLLPVQTAEDEDDEGDPRDELVRRLLEYKKYKEAAQKLADAETVRRELFRRGLEYPFLNHDEEPPEFSLSMTDMLKAVQNVLDQIKGENKHHVYSEVYTVDGQGALILERLAQIEKMRFEEVFREAKIKMEVVVTFVAMLELIKRRRLRAYQIGSYDEIWLSLRPPEDEFEGDEEIDDASEDTSEITANEEGPDGEESESGPRGDGESGAGRGAEFRVGTDDGDGTESGPRAESSSAS